jgi:outer membrane protein OmpA-like peptidoglycan-associated protein
MKRVYSTFVLICFMSINQVYIHSQRMAIDMAEEYIHAREYHQAIPVLQKLSAFKNTDMWKYKLGWCYLKTRNFHAADSVFSRITDAPLADYYISFGEVKQALGKYDEALALLEKYKVTNTNDPLATNMINSCKYADINTTESNWHIRLNPSFMNGIYTGGCFYNNHLWFGFDKSVADGESYALPDHNIYASNASSQFTEYEANDILLLESKYHIGGISFSKISNEVIYSIQDSEMSSTSDKKLSQHHISNSYLNTLNLVLGQFDGKQITSTQSFAFNSKEYSCIHPNIAASGNTCYFSSDMPGGYGGFDIYKIEKKGNEWAQPVNMGEHINGTGDEMYPFEYRDSVLYFSSTSWAGYGGSDIFRSKIFHQQPGISINIGKPANSSADDFGISFTSENAGYFFTNRNAQPGTDELYNFDFPVEVDYDTTNGFIVDALTQEPLSNAHITIVDKDSMITLLNTDSNGTFNFNHMHPNEVYLLKAEKDKYHEKVMAITSNNEGTISVAMELDPVLALNSIFTLHNILFEYNDYRLTRESMLILDRVAYVMLKNPKTVFELSAHTDARGLYNDNLALSQKRAESTVYYLLSKGVEHQQLIPVGCGEKFLKNNCDSDSYCAETDHAVNRRVEVKVIAFGK